MKDTNTRRFRPQTANYATTSDHVGALDPHGLRRLRRIQKLWLEPEAMSRQLGETVIEIDRDEPPR